MSRPEPASIRAAAELIQHSSRVVCFSGAGISTPSGIPDFRSAGIGLWHQTDPMTVASIETFRDTPDRFFNWFHTLAEKIHQATPNAAHFALAELADHGHLNGIITQNIDGLHTEAGSSDVLEIHGSLQRMVCLQCHQVHPSGPHIHPFIKDRIYPKCSNCGAVLKPDVVLFGERLPDAAWLAAEQACRNCDLMIIAGSSLDVSPANRLPLVALEHGSGMIVINHSRTYMDRQAIHVFRENVADVLPRIASEVVNIDKP